MSTPATKRKRQRKNNVDGPLHAHADADADDCDDANPGDDGDGDGTAAAAVPAFDPEMERRAVRARAAAGPILTASESSIANRDLEHLTLGQLERESARMQVRMRAVRERIIHLLATGKRPRKRCSVEGCTSIAQGRGLCNHHGQHKDMCKVEGCEKWAQRGGKCYTHGAKYKLCRVEGCTNKVQQGGVCCRHGATKKKKKEKPADDVERRVSEEKEEEG